MAALPNRDCGPCTACCTFLPIRTDTLDKPTNVVCPHCVEGRGCTVYAIRPTVCADWLCGWKTMAEIPDDWRPSDSGIMFRDEDMPDREMTIALLDSTPRRLPAKARRARRRLAHPRHRHLPPDLWPAGPLPDPPPPEPADRQSGRGEGHRPRAGRLHRSAGASAGRAHLGPRRHPARKPRPANEHTD